MEPNLQKQLKKEKKQCFREIQKSKETFETLQTDLRRCIRDYIDTKGIENHSLPNNNVPPFSKGVAKHFWNAAKNDDPEEMLNTLLTDNMVRDAVVAVHRGFRSPENRKAANRTLSELLMAENHPLIPNGGAVKCVEALKKKFPATMI